MIFPVSESDAVRSKVRLLSEPGRAGAEQTHPSKKTSHKEVGETRECPSTQYFPYSEVSGRETGPAG